MSHKLPRILNVTAVDARECEQLAFELAHRARIGKTRGLAIIEWVGANQIDMQLAGYPRRNVQAGHWGAARLMESLLWKDD
jgi:hypothetical protein